LNLLTMLGEYRRETVTELRHCSMKLIAAQGQ
jgi:hypothetical protein